MKLTRLRKHIEDLVETADRDGIDLNTLNVTFNFRDQKNLDVSMVSVDTKVVDQEAWEALVQTYIDDPIGARRKVHSRDITQKVLEVTGLIIDLSRSYTLEEINNLSAERQGDDGLS